MRTVVWFAVSRFGFQNTEFARKIRAANCLEGERGLPLYFRLNGMLGYLKRFMVWLVNSDIGTFPHIKSLGYFSFGW